MNKKDKNKEPIWGNAFAKSWGANKVSELDKSTQLSVKWIDENVVSGLIDVLAEAKKELDACYKKIGWGVENKTSVMQKIEEKLSK